MSNLACPTVEKRSSASSSSNDLCLMPKSGQSHPHERVDERLVVG